MDPVTHSIVEARKTLPLRPAAQVEGEIRSRMEELERKESLEPIEKFATAVARKALFDLALVRDEPGGIRMVAAWVRMSLSEPANEKRLIVTQVGSVLLCTDFKEKNGNNRP